MNVRFKGAAARAPWALAFSFARAIQQPGMDIWAGKDANAAAAQKSFRHRAQCNQSARRGQYTASMEATA
jgi:fructose-bisphosphate aldolase class I